MLSGNSRTDFFLGWPAKYPVTMSGIWGLKKIIFEMRKSEIFIKNLEVDETLGQLLVAEGFSTIEEILEVTTKPIIVDGDTGGRIEHFKFRVKTLERLGVSAIIIEDKIGDKRNSLFGTTIPQDQDSIKNFSQKIHLRESTHTSQNERCK